MRARRSCTTTGGLALLLTALTCAPELGAPPMVARPPNVVLFIVDDLRSDAFGFTGNPTAATPHIDAFRSQATWYRNTFVVHSLCSPSRATILTGQYASRFGVRDNKTPLPADAPTVATELHTLGYQTGLVGKWHLGNLTGEPQPGFDRWVSFPQQGDYVDPLFNIDGTPVRLSGHITDLLTAFALDFIAGRDRANPFLLILSHKAVHERFTPQERYLNTLASAPVVLPPSWNEGLSGKPRYLSQVRLSGDTAPLVSRIRRYHETLRGVDESLGLVFAALAREGILDSTVIIFTSDNGYLFGEHNLTDKRVAYEESIRVPLIVRYPRSFEPGAVRDQTVLNTDIMPTILQIITGTVPHWVDGVSLLDLANGNVARDGFLYEYYQDGDWPQYPTIFAWRTPSYKLITYPTDPEYNELYDLVADPSELENLWADSTFAEVRRTLNERMLRARAHLRCIGC
jgi:N-acetylglucosamine-6-sulfatase